MLMGLKTKIPPQYFEKVMHVLCNFTCLEYDKFFGTGDPLVDMKVY